MKGQWRAQPLGGARAPCTLYQASALLGHIFSFFFFQMNMIKLYLLSIIWKLSTTKLLLEKRNYFCLTFSVWHAFLFLLLFYRYAAFERTGACIDATQLTSFLLVLWKLLTEGQRKVSFWLNSLLETRLCSNLCWGSYRTFSWVGLVLRNLNQGRYYHYLPT